MKSKTVKRKNRVLPVIAIIAAVLAIIVMFIITATDGLKEGLNVPLNGIDLSKIDDGVYEGTYDCKRWTNTVRVYVADRKITKIEIVKDVAGANITHCFGETANRVISAQNTDIDAVTGATVTTKAYLKAIENALSQNKEN